MQTEARLDLDGRPALLLGTIAGFVPDAGRVRAAFESERPGLVGLGIPPEDLEGLRVLREDPKTELPEVDPQTERLFALLSRFGPCQVPSPDLEAAEALAHDAGVPAVALDMDDETHSHLYIRTVGFRHAVRSGRLLRQMLQAPFPQDDPHDLAAAWDAYATKPKPLRAVEAAREAHMAARLWDEAQARPAGTRVLAVLPVARLAGVAARLPPRPS